MDTAIPTDRSSARTDAAAPLPLADRIAALPWPALSGALDAHGNALIPGLLSDRECAALRAGYDDPAAFRSHTIMSQRGYGSGEYKYYAAPLPVLVEDLRTAIYPYLVEVANRWSQALDGTVRYPAAHADFLARCHEAGQRRPTPLLLKYGIGDFNCLHQDLYGEHVFPLQVAILLSQPGRDFSGGEFVLTEQRPRQQSRAEVVPLQQGDAVIFAVSHRPVPELQDISRAELHHGVSRVRTGQRFTLGVIFHDAA